MPDNKKFLRTLGEMVVVRSINNTRKKLEDKGKTGMLLGYAQKHTVGTNRMLNHAQNVS